MTYHAPTPADTEAIAEALARMLTGGEVLALHGDLGAGKTQFVRGLVRGLGGSSRAVSSPTYVLLNVYEGGRLVVYHLDAYRVAGPDDFEGIGFGELLEQPDAVVAVEWAERVDALLPPVGSVGRVDVTIEPAAGADGGRSITIERGTIPSPAAGRRVE